MGRRKKQPLVMHAADAQGPDLLTEAASCASGDAPYVLMQGMGTGMDDAAAAERRRDAEALHSAWMDTSVRATAAAAALAAAKARAAQLDRECAELRERVSTFECEKRAWCAATKLLEERVRVLEYRIRMGMVDDRTAMVAAVDHAARVFAMPGAARAQFEPPVSVCVAHDHHDQTVATAPDAHVAVCVAHDHDQSVAIPEAPSQPVPTRRAAPAAANSRAKRVSAIRALLVSKTRP